MIMRKSNTNMNTSTLRIDVITIFPRVFHPVLNESILKRAQMKGRVSLFVHDLRDFSPDKHRKVDDRPFGGGPGMIMRPEPIFNAIEYIKSDIQDNTASVKSKKRSRIILLSPKGHLLNQDIGKRLAGYRHLIIICGHYEGVDERVRRHLVDEEISIGDYILTGGELAAAVVVDSVVRLIPGVLGNFDSAEGDSFSCGKLDYPHYTRPEVYRGMKVPDVLLSGNHAEIDRWREQQAVERTLKKRSDLIQRSKDKE